MSMNYTHYVNKIDYLEKEIESLRHELVAAHETIADYQEQTETLIQSCIDADNALEIVNNQLATAQAERDTWRNQDVAEWKSERKAFALTLAELKSAQAEISTMNVDNTNLWKENERLRQQLSEPVIRDINALDGNHIATIPLTFTGWHIEKDGSDSLNNGHLKCDNCGMSEDNPKQRDCGASGILCLCDGCWKIRNANDYEDIVERPVVHSDSYNQVDEDNTQCDNHDN